MSKQLLLALGAGGAATAAVVASAASLGTVDSTDLGAGTSVVASCDSGGIDVSYTTEFSAGEYRVSTVTLADVAAACDGQDVKVTLYGAGNTAIGSGEASAADFSSGSADVTIDDPGSAAADDVTGVAVVISGETS